MEDFVHTNFFFCRAFQERRRSNLVGQCLPFRSGEWLPLSPPEELEKVEKKKKKKGGAVNAIVLGCLYYCITLQPHA